MPLHSRSSPVPGLILIAAVAPADGRPAAIARSSLAGLADVAGLLLASHLIALNRVSGREEYWYRVPTLVEPMDDA